MFVLERCAAAAAAKGQIKSSAINGSAAPVCWNQNGHSCGCPGTLELPSHLTPPRQIQCRRAAHSRLTPIAVLKQVLLPHAGDFKARSINPGLVSNKAELCAAGLTNETNSAVTLAEFSARTQE